MIRTSFLAFFVLAVAAVLSSLTNLAADEPKVPAKNENPFAGKVVFLRDRGELLMEKVQMKQLGNASFLVGRLCDKSQPGDGKTIWIAVSAIDSLIEFDSIEEARKVLDQIKEQQRVPPPPPPGVS